MNKLFINATFKLIVENQYYLTSTRDLRWNLQAGNKYASMFGEEDNFYMFVVMSEKSDTLSKGTVSLI
jgi:phage anti-repressor protein